MNEVDLDGNVIHVQSLEMPSSEGKKKANLEGAETKEEAPTVQETPKESVTATDVAIDTSTGKSEVVMDAAPSEEEPWPEHFNASLMLYLSKEQVEELKKIFLEGPEPPFVSDSGWSGRQAKTTQSTEDNLSEAPASVEPPPTDRERGTKGKRGRDRGGRRGGRGGWGGTTREDHRRVISNVNLHFIKLRKRFVTHQALN